MLVDRPTEDTHFEMHATQYFVMIVFATLHFGYVSCQMGVDEAYPGLV